MLVAISVLTQIFTVDNPRLTQSAVAEDLAYSNLFKDMAVIAAALLVSSKSTKIVHRSEVRSKKRH